MAHMMADWMAERLARAKVGLMGDWSVEMKVVEMVARKDVSKAVWWAASKAVKKVAEKAAMWDYCSAVRKVVEMVGLWVSSLAAVKVGLSKSARVDLKAVTKVVSLAVRRDILRAVVMADWMAGGRAEW